MTTPGKSHAADPARRQVGESYKDYAGRIYGMYRAAKVDLDKAVSGVPEFTCPACGATTRARMADHAAFLEHPEDREGT